MEKIVNGVKTNYQVFGEKGAKGYPLLILHGWGSKIERWAPIAEKLAESGVKVIVPDIPGFGDLEKLSNPWKMNDYLKWLEEFRTETGLNDFYLAGHSFGGALAVKMAIKYPQNVQKLFLISAASVRKKTNKKSFIKSLAKIASKFSFLPMYGFIRKAFYKFIIRRSDYPYVEGTMKETFKNVINEDLAQFTGFIKMPTIIIWGDKDKSTPVEDAYFMNEKIKDTKLLIIKGAGHALNKECPETLVEKILSNIQ